LPGAGGWFAAAGGCPAPISTVARAAGPQSGFSGNPIIFKRGFFCPRGVTHNRIADSTRPRQGPPFWNPPNCVLRDVSQSFVKPEFPPASFRPAENEFFSWIQLIPAFRHFLPPNLPIFDICRTGKTESRFSGRKITGPGNWPAAFPARRTEIATSAGPGEALIIFWRTDTRARWPYNVVLCPRPKTAIFGGQRRGVVENEAFQMVEGFQSKFHEWEIGRGNGQKYTRRRTPRNRKRGGTQGTTTFQELYRKCFIYVVSLEKRGPRFPESPPPEAEVFQRIRKEKNGKGGFHSGNASRTRNFLAVFWRSGTFILGMVPAEKISI